MAIALPTESIRRLIDMISGKTPLDTWQAVKDVAAIMNYVADLFGEKDDAISITAADSKKDVDKAHAVMCLQSLLPPEAGATGEAQSRNLQATGVIGDVLANLPKEVILEWLVNFLLKWLEDILKDR